MGKELEGPARVRLFFTDRHILSKKQRSKGLRRCWAALRRETTTIGEFKRHIWSLFGLRCISPDHLVLSMDGVVLPSVESTCFRDKDLIMVQSQTTTCKKKKKKITISNHSPENENGNSQKKRTSPSPKEMSSKEKLKLTPHERPLVINTNQNNNKSIMVNEKNKLDPILKNGVLGTPRNLTHGQTNLIFPGAGPSNWQTYGPKHNGPTSAKRNNWKPKNKSNLELKISLENKGKSIIEEEEEKEEYYEDDLDFESLYPLLRLPREGDIIAYRLTERSSGRFDLSHFRVGEVLVFDQILMDIVLGPVPKYPIFPYSEKSQQKNSLYEEDGTLGIDFGSIVDLRLVKESEQKIKITKGKNKGKKNADNNVNNWENGVSSYFGDSGGNKKSNSAWEIGEASNTKDDTTPNNGWDTWAPSNETNGTFNPQMGHNNRGSGSHGTYPRQNNGRGENGWDISAPSTSRAGQARLNLGQNGNFASRRGYS